MATFLADPVLRDEPAGFSSGTVASVVEAVERGAVGVVHGP